MTYGFTTTDAFKQRLAAEQAGGPKIVFTSFAVGDGNGVVPALPVNGLVHQVYSAPVASVQVDATNNKQVNIECPIPDVTSGGGLGLGLFIAKTLLERSGATLVFRNQPVKGGAEVEVAWNRADFERSLPKIGP